MIYIGIDLHSRNMILVALNDNGKLLAEEKFATTPANPTPVTTKFIIICQSYQT